MWAIYVLCTIASYTYVCQPLEFQSSLLRFQAAAELHFNNFRVQIFSELVNGKIQLYHARQTFISTILFMALLSMEAVLVD